MEKSRFEAKHFLYKETATIKYCGVVPNMEIGGFFSQPVSHSHYVILGGVRGGDLSGEVEGEEEIKEGIDWT